jgi:hypothetical protein
LSGAPSGDEGSNDHMQTKKKKKKSNESKKQKTKKTKNKKTKHKNYLISKRFFRPFHVHAFRQSHLNHLDINDTLIFLSDVPYLLLS